MSDFDTVLTGRVVTASHVVDRGFVAIRDGRIALVGEGEPPAAAERHDFGSAFVMPGGIDGQVHSRSQAGQEDFVWSTRAAAAGGITTIVDMPYDDGVLIASADAFRAKAESAAEQARVDFALYATVHPAEGPARIGELAGAGAAGFKFSTFETHPDRFPRIPTAMLLACFEAIAPTGRFAGIHNENQELVASFTAAVGAAGLTDYRAHGLARPPVAEALATAEVYELGVATGCPVHIVHSSIGRCYEMAAEYRRAGHAATIEACIHYLTLSEEDDVARLGGRAKINPPVRGRAEREALWAHLAAGNVTIVSSDHVSWSLDRKSDPDMTRNASGVPGLEVLYPLLLKGLLERGLSPTWAARLLADNPARLFGIGDAKGALRAALDADIAVLGHRPGRYDPAASGHTIVGWSPYEGIDFTYRPVATFRRGALVFDGAAVLAPPGSGRFVRPPEPAS